MDKTVISDGVKGNPQGESTPNLNNVVCTFATSGFFHPSSHREGFAQGKYKASSNDNYAGISTTPVSGQ
ncbi:hypothetical protein GJ744_004903 [Endocarpon pusillum]|uniref:Uncharacterized protein n=1 Tax=Endocarpon pusillum TaxID=364733 RepID=A0A8H7ALN8_9EURO|nr:hypothetical protein GJ744_004903 [Endocarpon pusillum]